MSEAVTDAAALESAHAWHAQDPDDITRDELATLIADGETGDPGAIAELHDRFDTRLEFGTAGLRGRIGAGSNRMNRVLVGQAAAGLGAWLVENRAAPSVVIGWDGRTNSEIFARDSAEIMAGAGVRVILLPRLLPTPVLAFAVRHFGAEAGVMVTASHNPPADNGYKVYLGGDDRGAQINTPVDAEIAAHIYRIAHEARVTELPRSRGYETASEEVIDEYVRRTALLAGTPAAPLRIVYTAMHGVGWETASRVFEAAGFGTPASVAEQQQPDAAFPTVAFPNPEEPGALDLSLALAVETDADIVIANDPDADRLGVAIPTVDGWRRLTGNEVGSLLGWRAAERLVADPSATDRTLAASLVSSPALGVIASEHGLDFAETLTGFKWISRAPGLAFGYEEALGYLVDPELIRDKDGISAAVDFLALASELAATGRTVEQRLLEFSDRFGAYASAQVSVRVSDLADIPRIMAGLRADPPSAIGGVRVLRVDDFLDGFGDFPPNDILRFALESDGRVIIRPSGTEPKVKVYIDAASSESSGVDRQRAAQRVVDDLESGIRELLA